MHLLGLRDRTAWATLLLHAVEVMYGSDSFPKGMALGNRSRHIRLGKQDGLGLGLAVSRRTVLNHGGDIWMEPARGARFVIRLPLQSAQRCS